MIEYGQKIGALESDAQLMAKQMKDLHSSFAKKCQDDTRQFAEIKADLRIVVKSMEAFDRAMMKQVRHDEQIKQIEKNNTELWEHMDDVEKVVAKNEGKTEESGKMLMNMPKWLFAFIGVLIAAATFFRELWIK